MQIVVTQNEAGAVRSGTRGCRRLHNRGQRPAEGFGLVRAAASPGGPLDAKQLARPDEAAKGLGLTDAVLAKAIGHRLIQSQRMQEYAAT
jgi:hypothetical protein